MKIEKINYIREYYRLGSDVPDLEIEKTLGTSLGAVCFDIKKAKLQLVQAIISSFPKLKPKSTWQDQPITDGYYWLREFAEPIRIVYVFIFDGTVCESEVVYFNKDMNKNLNKITGKWYGPITPPKED